MTLNFKSNPNDLVYLVESLINSSSKHVKMRIDSEKNQTIFINTIRDIQFKIRTALTLDEIEDLYKELLIYEQNKRFSFSLFTNPKKYRMLAFELVGDIINSIRIRFVDGGNSVYRA